ncbi:MAG: gamma-glutamyl-gamma-aminobutyrate hydrolase family protein [Anaerolineae bacterium]
MICLVDMEHDEGTRRHVSTSDAGTGRTSARRPYVQDICRRLEAISHTECVTRRYTNITRKWLDVAAIDALVLSGNVTEWDQYDEADLQPLTEIVRSASLPILGLCGGLQFIAMAHGAGVGPIRELANGEEDAHGGLGSGFFKEWGFKPVKVVGSDPLFDGLADPVFLQAHYWEVKSVPDRFELLASTEVCPVQALRRTGSLVYGTQFHPEGYIAEPADRDSWLVQLVYPSGYAKEQPDGRRLLANFFRTAGILSQ